MRLSCCLDRSKILGERKKLNFFSSFVRQLCNTSSVCQKRVEKGAVLFNSIFPEVDLLLHIRLKQVSSGLSLSSNFSHYSTRSLDLVQHFQCVSIWLEIQTKRALSLSLTHSLDVFIVEHAVALIIPRARIFRSQNEMSVEKSVRKVVRKKCFWKG